MTILGRVLKGFYPLSFFILGRFVSVLVFFDDKQEKMTTAFNKESIMTTNLSHLNPHNVWSWFEKICAIPHPTFHEQKLGDFIVEQARTVGQQYQLSVEKDAKGNIRIQKPASKGFENHQEVAIQAHYDMVAQKNKNSNHDFIHDAIQPQIKDGWVWATDTTLGADNGIGLAMALAVAFSDDIAHPPLTLILTSEEEVGMGGVQALDSHWLQMPYLINLDSEDAGELFVGCAGGRDITLDLAAKDVQKTIIQPTDEQSIIKISVTGLQGGHSGIDIHKGIANANLVLARLLAQVYAEQDFQLIHWQGGVLRNVITREAEATILANPQTIQNLVSKYADIIFAELQHSEPKLTIKTEVLADDTNPQAIVSQTDTQAMLDLIRIVPNGVLRMSDTFDGVVETSISMGIVKLEEGKLHIACLMRSLAETPKDNVCAQMEAIARTAQATITISDDYPGWQPDKDSLLLKHGINIMTNHYGKEPNIQVIHAGLECGILKGKAPHMDMISFGPNIRSAHSPKERVEIATVAECWDILLDLLKIIPKK